MSVVAVHGPHTWGQPFLARSTEIAVNLLAPLELEFKYLRQTDLALALVVDPFDWDFGDGSQLDNGYEVRHIYATPGEKTVTVQVQTTEGVRTASITFTLPDGDGQVLKVPESKEAEDEAA